MLTGEYVVLDGAMSLALPTKYGQSLQVETIPTKGIHWQSFDENGILWYEDTFETSTFESVLKNKLSNTITNILEEARKLNPSFLTNKEGIIVKNNLTFPRNWGLGSSSTLINNIAQWAQVDAFKLLWNSFGGSGFDIAAAQNDSPVFYKKNNNTYAVQQVTLSWDFKDELFFVHLNQKQDSKEGINLYRKKSIDLKSIEKITDLTRKLLLCYTLSDFEKILQSHENCISDILNIPTVKENLFKDFPRVIKSLGAWGGDFILATGGIEEQEYFRKKGYQTIIPFEDMIL